MNNIETEILALLKHDCRLTADKIAKAVGSDENTVKKTITNLEKRGVILGYSALTDEHALGGDTVEALIEVRVTRCTAADSTRSPRIFTSSSR